MQSQKCTQRVTTPKSIRRFCLLRKPSTCFLWLLKASISLHSWTTCTQAKTCQHTMCIERKQICQPSLQNSPLGKSTKLCMQNSIVSTTRRKACSHESSWNHRGAVVGRCGTVVGNITGLTTLPRRDCVGVMVFVHIACLAAVVAAIMEAIVEAWWKRRGRPRYSTRCVVTGI